MSSYCNSQYFYFNIYHFLWLLFFGISLAIIFQYRCFICKCELSLPYILFLYESGKEGTQTTFRPVYSKMGSLDFYPCSKLYGTDSHIFVQKWNMLFCFQIVTIVLFSFLHISLNCKSRKASYSLIICTVIHRICLFKYIHVPIQLLSWQPDI